MIAIPLGFPPANSTRHCAGLVRAKSAWLLARRLCQCGKSEIPTGFNHSAQGRAERATLGGEHKFINSERVESIHPCDPSESNPYFALPHQPPRSVSTERRGGAKTVT